MHINSTIPKNLHHECQQKNNQHEIIDLTNDLLEEQQRLIDEENQYLLEEEQWIINDEEQRLLMEQQLIIEEQRQIIEEQWLIVVDKQHVAPEQQVHNEGIGELHLHEAENGVGEEGREVQLENERLVCVRLIANEMTRVSTTHYIPSEKQVHCVTVDHYTVQEALTIGGDHHTPCRECLLNDPDECFWLVNSITLHVLGWQVRTGRELQNKQVQYFLYKSFAEEEYKYLRDRRVDDEENIFEFRVGLPRFPLPFCVERDIKRNFPNEDGTAFVGFCRRNNRRGGRGHHVWNICQ